MVFMLQFTTLLQILESERPSRGAKSDLLASGGSESCPGGLGARWLSDVDCCARKELRACG